MSKKDTKKKSSQADVHEQDDAKVMRDEPEEELGGAEADQYAYYDEEVAEVLRADDRYLEEFCDYLMKSSLSEGTIGRHLRNARLFVHDWLGGREGEPMEAGPDSIGGFLGDYYIRRCTWSTPANIKTTATGIKKFYKCMVDLGHMTQADYDDLVDTIKWNMPEWQWKCSLYNDPEVEWEEIAAEFGFGPFAF